MDKFDNATQRYVLSEEHQKVMAARQVDSVQEVASTPHGRLVGDEWTAYVAFRAAAARVAALREELQVAGHVHAAAIQKLCEAATKAKPEVPAFDEAEWKQRHVDGRL